MTGLKLQVALCFALSSFLAFLLSFCHEMNFFMFCHILPHGMKKPLPFGRGDGRNRTRTCDPRDVNTVLCLGGKVYKKQMLGVHVQKNVDITWFPCFVLHPAGVRKMGVHRVFTGVFIECSRRNSVKFTGIFTAFA